MAAMCMNTCTYAYAWLRACVHACRTQGESGRGGWEGGTEASLKDLDLAGTLTTQHFVSARNEHRLYAALEADFALEIRDTHTH